MNPIVAAIAIKSVALLAAAWILSLGMRRASAAGRHLVWTAASIALLVLPFFSASLPALPFAPAAKLLTPAVAFTAESQAARPIGQTPPPPQADRHAAKSVPFHTNWARIIAMLWAMGAAFGWARWLASWAAMRSLRAHCPAARVPELESLCGEIGVRRRVAVLEAARGTMPMSFGTLHPAIFLPADAIEWSVERRRAVLLHELAHIRRGDLATQLVGRAAFSLYWWNPLGWLAWREFLKLRERAADDVVLQAGTRASDYAAHLLDIAGRKTCVPAAASVAMVQASHLEVRLAAILDSRMRRKAPGRWAAALASVAAIVAVAPLAAIRAQSDALPADVDATIRAASGQKNFAMLDRAAEGFVKIRRYEIAQKLLEASLKVRADISGTSSESYSDGLLKLGDLAWDHAGVVHASAHNYYAEAIAAGDRPAAARALMRLGILAFRDPAAAEGYVQRAINVDPRGSDLAEELAWMAAIRDRQGNAAEAQALFTRALATAASGSMEQALVSEMYASFLAPRGNGTSPDKALWAETLVKRAGKIRSEQIASLSPKADWGNVQRIGGDVKPPTVKKKVDPVYSQEARALKIDGAVVFRLVIGPDGCARNIVLERGVGFGLDERALDAVSEWQFEPGTLDGLPVPVLATIEVNFRLL